VVRELEVKIPVEGLIIETPGVKVPVVEASVSVVWAPVEVEAEEVVPETEAEEDSEETVEDVPVVEALEELFSGSVTSNFWDWARMPVFWASVERRLIWKPELSALSVSGLQRQIIAQLSYPLETPLRPLAV
jgi:hypothetical protein